jgi:hypothetical protein
MKSIYEDTIETDVRKAYYREVKLVKLAQVRGPVVGFDISGVGLPVSLPEEL